MEPSQDLYETPADRLDAFVEHCLQPHGEWKEEVQDAWQRSEKFLRNHCFRDELLGDQEVRVLKVVKGGSSGKGTTLNHSSDVDMVLFLSCFSSFQDQAMLRGFIISRIEEKLTHCSRSLAYNITLAPRRETTRVPRSLSFQVQARRSSEIIRVDVLPAFNALRNFCPDSKPPPEIYENLITTHGPPGEFSPSFTELQRHFVKSRPTKLKSLLRLVKHWYLQYVKRKYRKAAVPPKYALELLTIYAWEMGTNKNESFNLDEGFIAVMKLLRDYEDICIYWTKYYDFENEVVRIFIKKQLKECRPIILDPADPTNNLGREKRWDLVAKEAVYCLKQDCCRTEDSSQAWHVQEPGGDRQLLSSRRTLADYGIFSKVNVRVLETFPPEIQVFVKDSSGHTKPYAIDPDNSIRDLKEKIEEAGGPCVEDQILRFQGRKLWNHRSLSDLQIEDCDTITLIRKDYNSPVVPVVWPFTM
nr:2'-5'-oligoadenylate synthase-like protein 2 isoform X2 [Equus asinus]